jgi:hypothetical protein
VKLTPIRDNAGLLRFGVGWVERDIGSIWELQRGKMTDLSKLATWRVKIVLSIEEG